MKISVKIEGDLNAMMASEVRAGQRAVSASMRDAGVRLKTNWRGQITGAGLGARLANAVRSQAYPQGRPSLNAAALVWSKAPVITAAHEKGVLIRSQNGFWLAIPTAAAGKGARGGRITPEEWERRTGRRLTFVYRSGRTALLIDEGRRAFRKASDPVRWTASGTRKRANRSVIVFVLTPQSKLKKKLDLMAAAEQVGASLPATIVANWRDTR